MNVMERDLSRGKALSLGVLIALLVSLAEPPRAAESSATPKWSVDPLTSKPARSTWVSSLKRFRNSVGSMRTSCLTNCRISRPSLFTIRRL
jgi:hypothetical protein